MTIGSIRQTCTMRGCITIGTDFQLTNQIEPNRIMKTKKEETLDVTPTWTALMPVMLDNLHQPLVRSEVMRMIGGTVTQAAEIKELSRRTPFREALYALAGMADEFNERGGA